MRRDRRRERERKGGREEGKKGRKEDRQTDFLQVPHSQTSWLAINSVSNCVSEQKKENNVEETRKRH